jgi:hypothetical protein
MLHSNTGPRGSAQMTIGPKSQGRVGTFADIFKDRQVLNKPVTDRPATDLPLDRRGRMLHKALLEQRGV